MTGPIRWIMAGALTLAVALPIAWLSQAPTTYARPGDALLRLSWRMDGLRVEDCRPRTEEELAALAPHMRTPEVCTRGFVDHELSVSIDGAELMRDTVRPGGARRDRPVYVYRDIPLAPGRHSLSVTFAALVPPGFEPVGAQIAQSFQGELEVAPTEVVLIGFDPATSTLVRIGS